jgi:DNA-binding Lrp family transcriptional regulator
MEPPTWDENDLILVSALQDAPRAQWTDLARILEMGQDTLAERWRRISTAGLAWVTLVDQREISRRSATFVLVQTSNGARSEVLECVVSQPLVRTVHCVSGRYNMVLLLETSGPHETESFIADTLENVRGITDKQVVPAVGVVADASQWRTAALTATQRRSLAQLDTKQVTGSGVSTTWALRDPVAHALLDELAIDGRMSTSELARQLNRDHRLTVSTSTVARKLTRLLKTPGLRIRCDVSAPDLGWQAVVMFWGRISSTEAARIWSERSAAAATAHRKLPEMRSLLILAGSANLHVTAWLHTLDALPELEARLATWLPSLRIHDLSVVLSTHKRMGFPLVGGRRKAGSTRPTTTIETPLHSHPV